MILLVGRRGSERRLGGDAMQVAETEGVLRAAGVDARTVAPDVSPTAGDIVHLHNIQRVLDWGDLPERARAAGARVVVTPLYHPLQDYHRRGRRGLDAGLARLVPDADVFAGLRWGTTRGLRTRAAEVLAAADRVLLVDRGEETLLRRDFGGLGTTDVVPVAVPELDAEHVPDLPDRFVACVGRIEPLKNPRAVLEAAETLGISVVFVGPTAGARHATYVAGFRAALRSSSSTWRGELSPAAVRGVLRKATAHVLGSWTEVVGRVTLEAALEGAAVVGTDVGFAPTYLAGTGARFVPPGDADALRGALAAAIEEGRPGRDGPAATRVRERYTWNIVGEMLRRALAPVGAQEQAS